jgi:hypothetical protein
VQKFNLSPTSDNVLDTSFKIEPFATAGRKVESLEVAPHVLSISVMTNAKKLESNVATFEVNVTEKLETIENIESIRDHKDTSLDGLDEDYLMVQLSLRKQDKSSAEKKGSVDKEMSFG